jgi:hypothetical protein
MNYSRASSANVWDGSKHKSSENLIAYSNPVTSQWTETNTAITVNSTAAPDGTTTASNVLETAATGYHETRETFACTNAVSHTATFYAKANGRTVIRFLPRTSSGVIANVEFTLSGAGSESLISGTATRSIAAVGSGGWYKLTVTFTGNATATGEFQVNICESAGTDSYAGDATKGVYLWGAQVSSTGETALNATSGQIHRQYASSLVSKANNAARFEVGTDGQSEGILIEGQAQNLATYSSDFSNAAWSKTRTSVEASAAIGPDGTLSASLIRDETSTNNTHHVYQLLPSIASGTVVTASVFAKAAGRTFLIIQNGSTTPFGGASYKVWFNLTSGTVGTISGSGVTASATDCGNGWTRCTVTFPASTATATHALQINSSEGDNDEYHVGDSYSGVLLFGAQYEQNSLSSSLISTSGSQVTRAADSLSVATADIPGFSEGVGTIVCETGGVASSTAVNQLAFGLNGPASSNLFSAGVNNGGVTDSTVRVYSQTPDGDQAFLNPGTATVGTGYKLACRYELDNIAASMNGGAVVSDTSGKVPVGIDTLWIGELEGNYHINSNIKRIAVYGEALSDTNLQALTS